MNPDQLIEQGDFEGALEALRQSTSSGQADPETLLTQFRMEVRLQEFDAAEKTIQRLCAIAPEAAPAMNQLAATARAERIATQRLSDPTIAAKRSAPGLPPPYSLALVKAALLHAKGDAAGAKAALAEAREATPAISGTLLRKNGATIRFNHLTDSDELTGATLPVYEGSQVLDIGYSEIHSIYFDDPRTNFDIMWPRAEITLVTGENLRVRIPALYAGSGRAQEGALRTGQMTMWSRDKGYAEGIGQRDLNFTTAEGSNGMVGLLTISSITFNNPLRSGVRLGGSPAFVNQGEQPWTPAQKAVAWAAGILYAVRFFAPVSMITDSWAVVRILMIVSGLIITGCAGWVMSQRTSKGNAVIGTMLVLAFTTLKWLL